MSPPPSRKYCAVVKLLRIEERGSASIHGHTDRPSQGKSDRAIGCSEVGVCENDGFSSVDESENDESSEVPTG